MQLSAAQRNSAGMGGGDLDDLVRQIGRLVRHPAYRRNAVVSAVLLRHLPLDGGYQWQGEAALRDRLAKAKLDASTLNHLCVGARSELARLRGPADT